MQVTDSMKNATLNKDNRTRFADAVVAYAFEERVKALFADHDKFTADLVRRSWGKTPQAQAANRKRCKTVKDSLKKLRDQRIYAPSDDPGSAGTSRVTVNAAGRRVDYVLDVAPESRRLGLLAYGVFEQAGRGRMVRGLGSREIVLTAGEPLVGRLFDLLDSAKELSDAADVLHRQVEAVLRPCRYFGDAMKAWPGVELFAENILSTSRELRVTGPQLQARVEALRAGDVDVKSALKTGGDA